MSATFFFDYFQLLIQLCVSIIQQYGLHMNAADVYIALLQEFHHIAENMTLAA